MAKCGFCNAKKGKRKCIAVNGVACSLCCGQSRSEDKCAGCHFFGPATRRYTQTPHYSLNVMGANMDLSDHADVVESALCAIDRDNPHELNDNIARDILERLLDKYHFGDTSPVFGGKLEEEGFNVIDVAIQKKCTDMSKEEIASILGTVYRSLKRRTNGGREYLTFIHQYVGAAKHDFNSEEKNKLRSLIKDHNRLPGTNVQ